MSSHPKDACPNCDRSKDARAKLCRDCWKEDAKPDLTCPRCGGEKVNYRAKVCGKCYWETRQTQQPGYQESLICPQCGGFKEPKSNICRQCFWKWANDPDVVIDTAEHSHHPKDACPQCGELKKVASNLCAECSKGQNIHRTLEFAHTPEAKLKRVQSRKSGGNPYSTWTEYNGTVYRSRWEARVAYYFDQQKARYAFEKFVIPYVDDEGKERIYIPDFWIYARKTFVEVKGYWLPGDRRKMSLVKEQNPDIVIEIWDKDVMDTIPKLPDNTGTIQPRLL